MASLPTLPSAADCVALANTGSEPLLPLIAVGVVALVIGAVVFAFSRGGLRRGGAALGLVVLLAAGGGLAAAGPVAPASAATACIDYSLSAELVSPDSIDSGDAVVTEFTITNVGALAGTPPVVVSIPKLEGFGGPTYFTGTDWTVDDSDAAFYYFTFSGALPKGATSTVASFSFTLTTADTEGPESFSYPVSIVTGSGGDSNTANNTVTLDVIANGAFDYGIEGVISPETAEIPLQSGGTAQVTFSVENLSTRAGTGPIRVIVPIKSGMSNPALAAGNTGWTLEVEGGYYWIFTYDTALDAGMHTGDGVFTFTGSNGNSSPVVIDVMPYVEPGGTDSSNDSITLPLKVDGIVA
ncbi:hypothetical protein [Leifsonia sp. AK011]|uniref:hypothetical protein n=1 Tax=Leifsonia sp. AK011 TaxID=2723075 RepID=UPI0015CB8D21|nr:hypothetical protein [Leifsonia sp. AK011]